MPTITTPCTIGAACAVTLTLFFHHRVVSLEADSIELAMPFLAPEAGPEGRLLHLGRGHMTFAARRVRAGC
jgi:hypothetical protein